MGHAKENAKENAKDNAKNNGKEKSKDKGKNGHHGKDTELLSKKAYEALLEPMQIELNHMARWLTHQGKRLVVIFEGRDTAGKGGAINAIASCLNLASVMWSP